LFRRPVFCGRWLKTFMPDLFDFQWLWSFMVVFITDFIEDFVKNIHMSEQQHYK